MVRLCQEMVPRECCDLLFPSLICPGDLPQCTDFLLRVHVSPPDTKLPPCQAITPHPKGRQQGSTCSAPQIPADRDLRIPDPERS